MKSIITEITVIHPVYFFSQIDAVDLASFPVDALMRSVNRYAPCKHQLIQKVSKSRHRQKCLNAFC